MSETSTNLLNLSEMPNISEAKREDFILYPSYEFEVLPYGKWFFQKRKLPCEIRCGDVRYKLTFQFAGNSVVAFYGNWNSEKQQYDFLYYSQSKSFKNAVKGLVKLDVPKPPFRAKS